MAERVLRHSETGYLLTTTSEVDDTVVVRRAPGPLRADPLAVSPTLIDRIAARAVEGMSWSTPTPSDGPALEYVVPGEASVATLLLAGMPVPGLVRMLAPLGAALRSVHEAGLEAGGAAGAEWRAGATQWPAPSGLRRVMRWLDSGDGPGEAARLHGVMAGVDGLLPALRSGVDALRSAPETVCLGAPGMNTVYPAPGGDHVRVLLTDEVCVAPAAWDLGWILGELLELANDPHLVPEPQTLAANPLAQAVLEAYGGGPSGRRLDATLVGTAAVLRWAVHLHDYAAYVEWADDFADRAKRLAQHAREPERVLG